MADAPVLCGAVVSSRGAHARMRYLGDASYLAGYQGQTLRPFGQVEYVRSLNGTVLVVMPSGTKRTTGGPQRSPRFWWSRGTELVQLGTLQVAASTCLSAIDVPSH